MNTSKEWVRHRLLGNVLVGHGKINSRRGAAAYLADSIKRKECEDCIVLIVSENLEVCSAWLDANKEHAYRAIVLNFDTLEQLMLHANLEQLVIVFDEVGNGAEQYSIYGPRMRAIVNRGPRLVMGISTIQPNQAPDRDPFLCMLDTLTRKPDAS